MSRSLDKMLDGIERTALAQKAWASLSKESQEILIDLTFRLSDMEALQQMTEKLAEAQRALIASYRERNALTGGAE